MFNSTTPFPIVKDQVCTILPPKARELLIVAAGVEPSRARGESVERTRALDYAIKRVKQTYPQFFKQPKEQES